MKIVNGLSVKTQNPSDIIHIAAILRKRCSDIKDFIERRIQPVDADADMKECLKCLQQHLQLGDYETSILTTYWCKQLFEEYGFTGAEHIEFLLKNSTHQGEDEQGQDQEQEQDQNKTINSQ
jgi:hypothetical protein